jgi:hypothetical protein
MWLLAMPSVSTWPLASHHRHVPPEGFFDIDVDASVHASFP